MSLTPPLNMVKKNSVQLMELNNNYGNQYYIPYSLGVLTAYAKQFTAIVDSFEFSPFLYKRERVEHILDKIGGTDIFGASVYVWNWSLSVMVGREVRACNPNSLIIYGGPHIPEDCTNLFAENPFIDIVVHGEGELVFTEILEAYHNGGDYTKVPGISYHNRNTGEIIRNPAPLRFSSLLDLPSPYLTGEFDLLLKENADIEWMALWETNRGCPFQCTYCDWGSATASKVLEFEWNRIIREIEWFAKNKIRFVFGCDANFGIRKRDIEIAKVLVATKKQYGYPTDYRVCFTKNSSQQIFDVAKVLHDGKMLKGVSLSMQSLDEGTLKAVKRSNIKLDVFQELQSKYNEAGISTFTELILGLPCESYKTFVAGINTLLERGQHSQILIYNCTVMPNAEMGGQSYQKEYQIKTAKNPIFSAHSTRSEDDPIVEYDSIIVQTKTMNLDDWRRMQRFAWAVQCFHMLGLLQSVAIFLRHWAKVSYSNFYEELIAYGYANPEGIVGRELIALDKILDNVLAGKGFDQYLYEFSDISWPHEEASLLRFSENKATLYLELKSFIEGYLSGCNSGTVVDRELLEDLIRYQKEIVVNPCDKGDIEITLCANIPDYVMAFRSASSASLIRKATVYRIIRSSNICGGDKKLYARNIVWYGRKGGIFLYPINMLEPAYDADKV